MFLILILTITFSLAENLPEPCCFKKTVGDLSYTLVNSEDTSIASRYGCISNCVYHQDDLPGKLFCFADGDLPATCTDAVSETANTKPTTTTKSAITTEGNSTVLSPGILISGGDGALTSAEVYSPGAGLSCELPSLPDERYGHTSDGATLCGGEQTSTSCITFSSGVWVTSHALAEGRVYHTSWNNKEEGKIILMGGWDIVRTTEAITEEENGGGPGFTLKYNIVGACAITEETTVIITGGYSTHNTVSRYGSSGHIKDLPSLNQGRYNHGCGFYSDNTGEQVFLVAGGWDISSTEILTRTSSAWVMVNSLPRKIFAVRGVTLDNILYMTGGLDDGDNERDEIYKWTGQQWVEVGKMKKARSFHAVSTIRLDDIKDFCT